MQTIHVLTNDSKDSLLCWPWFLSTCPCTAHCSSCCALSFPQSSLFSLFCASSSNSVSTCSPSWRRISPIHSVAPLHCCSCPKVISIDICDGICMCTFIHILLSHPCLSNVSMITIVLLLEQYLSALSCPLILLFFIVCSYSSVITIGIIYKNVFTLSFFSAPLSLPPFPQSTWCLSMCPSGGYRRVAGRNCLSPTTLGGTNNSESNYEDLLRLNLCHSPPHHCSHLWTAC